MLYDLFNFIAIEAILQLVGPKMHTSSGELHYMLYLVHPWLSSHQHYFFICFVSTMLPFMLDHILLSIG